MNNNYSFRSADEVSAMQSEKLKWVLEYVSLNSPFYQAHFQKHAVNIRAISSLEDLVSIPPITKDDLVNNNDRFLCVPDDQIVDHVLSSGTTGQMVNIGLTENDLQRLAFNEAASLSTAGITAQSKIQLMCTIDRCFMAGMAYFLGARKLGAGVIRVGNGNPAMQLNLMQRMKPDCLIAVPSHLIKLVQYARESNIDVAELGVEKVVCIGEPIRNGHFHLNEQANSLSESFGAQLFGTYASTEMATAFTDCEHGRGGHHQPDLIICEFLDDKNQPVDFGAEGELTITHLGVEGMPLLRFKTGDICKAHGEACECGRTSFRIGSIIGRKQQMIKYKGTTFYPPAIEEALKRTKNVLDYEIVLSNDLDGTDLVEVIIEAPEEAQAELAESLAQGLRSAIRVVPKLTIQESPIVRNRNDRALNRKKSKLSDFRKPGPN